MVLCEFSILKCFYLWSIDVSFGIKCDCSNIQIIRYMIKKIMRFDLIHLSSQLYFLALQHSIMYKEEGKVFRRQAHSLLPGIWTFFGSMESVRRDLQLLLRKLKFYFYIKSLAAWKKISFFLFKFQVMCSPSNIEIFQIHRNDTQTIIGCFSKHK